MALPVYSQCVCLRWSDNDGNAWVPVKAAIEAQLEAVELGGEHIYWDELGQDFRISDLKAGIYGREPWMAKIQQQMVMAKPSFGIAS